MAVHNLDSVGCVIDDQTGFVYDQDSGHKESSVVSIWPKVHINDCTPGWWEYLSDGDKQKLKSIATAIDHRERMEGDKK